ncbi:MAG: ABC transporter permease [Capsulimonadaceae bacterium]|nr:ABC transporter permease [Capsulimonadaceae bacterium]
MSTVTTNINTGEPFDGEHGVARRLMRNPFAAASIVVLFAIILLAIFAPARVTYVHATAGLFERPSSAHWLGADDSGYDILSRIAVGARVSLGIAVSAEIAIVVFGCFVGLIAGYFGGMVDTVLMRITDMMFAFPDILLAILVAVILRGGLANIFVALAVTGWPGIARLVRAQTMSLRRREFIDAARALGVPNGQIILRHILPNVQSTVVVASTVDIAGLVVAESTLSFLGIGVQPPLVSWGSLIAGSLQYMDIHPELLYYPALFLMLTVLSINFLGDALRDALDPRRAT